MAKKQAKKRITTKRIPQPTLLDVVTKLDKIELLLAKEEKEEEQIEREEEKEISEIQKLEQMEAEIKKDVAPHPLTKITYHDITKGMIGSFVGVAGHFTFLYGKELADGLSYERATVILGFSIFILILFMYFSGFRRVQEYNKYLFIRAVVIYVTAMSVAIGVLFLFGVLAWPIVWHEFYVNICAVSVLAVMGAATADMIGGE